MSGRGGILVSGRWHDRGVPIIYTAATLSLATLELLVHLDPGEFPPDFVSLEIQIPDDVSIDSVSPRDLPANWRSYPAPRQLQDLGMSWIAKGRSLALRVPSAVIPAECNYLLNPTHPRARDLEVLGIQPFRFDRRLI